MTKKVNKKKKKVIKLNHHFVKKASEYGLLLCDHVKDAQDISDFTWEQVYHIMSSLKKNKDVHSYSIVEVGK